MDLLQLTMQGRFTADPEVTTTQKNGKEYTYARFSLASNGRKVEGKETEAYFQNCVAFGATAKYIGDFYKKSSRIIVQGRPTNNNYTNKAGEKVFGTQLIVSNAHYDGYDGEKDNNANSGNSDVPGDGFMPSYAEGEIPEEFLNDPGLPFNS